MFKIWGFGSGTRRGSRRSPLALGGMVLVFLLVSTCLPAQAPSGRSSAPSFSRGVNLTGWFQTPRVQDMDFYRYGAEDFAAIKSLGFDVVRLPLNLNRMTLGDPQWTIDPLFFSFLDQAVAMVKAQGLSLILDNHTQEGPNGHDQDARMATILPLVWRQMAQRYRNEGDWLYYEVYNEPHGFLDADWPRIQGEVIAAIRQVDTRHTIIVGGPEWNSAWGLAKLPRYSDPKLLYTFHMYEPFDFTHQGASWAGKLDTGNVPYDSVSGRRAMEASISVAAQFAQERGVPIFCGEFGTYMVKSPAADRVVWYRDAVAILAKYKIPWTMWDWHGGFGIFEKDSAGVFPRDVNQDLVRALGLSWTKPPTVATSSTPMPVLPLTILGDSPPPKPRPQFSSWTNGGAANRYAQGRLSRYALELVGLGRYGSASFDWPDGLDLSQAVLARAKLVLWIKALGVAQDFELRFVMPEGPGLIPWRMAYTLGSKDFPWDGSWHQVTIALTDMKPTGGWDGTWHNPPGSFNWGNVATLQVVMETQAQVGSKVVIDYLGIEGP